MKYNPALDGIRALAVLAVMAFHARAPLSNGGFLGVDIFFVLSGYLITRLLLDEQNREGAIRIGAFYLRRVKRLYPPLLIFLAAYLLVAPRVWPDRENHLLSVIYSAVYIADYTKAFLARPNLLGHMWSLSVEEHFYLIWPLAMLLLARLTRSRALAALVVCWILASAWRWYWLAEGQHWSAVYHRFDAHSSGLILGCAFAYSGAKLPARYAQISALIAVAVLAALAPVSYIYSIGSLTGGLLVAEVAALLLIAAALAMPTMPVLSHPVMEWLGRYSYGLYLWHYPIMRWGRDNLDWSATFFLGGALSLALAAASYHTVESHFRRRRTHDTGMPSSSMPERA